MNSPLRSRSESMLTILEWGMRGWVIDGIANEAPDSIGLTHRTYYVPTRWYQHFSPFNQFTRFSFPRFSSVLFLHHRAYFKLADKFREKDIRVFLTHLGSKETFMPREIALLNQATKIILQNERLRDRIVAMGVNAEKTLISHGAVSTDVYFPSKDLPSANYVLITGDCKPRKNPELVRKVIESNPAQKFLIHGRGWREVFSHSIPDNVDIHEFDLAKNPKFMREASVLLSLSTIEGGPFTLLEALASGTPVVSTATGFAEEILSSENGILLSTNPSVGEVIEAILLIQDRKKKVHFKNLLPSDHSWSKFARDLYLT